MTPRLSARERAPYLTLVPGGLTGKRAAPVLAADPVDDLILAMEERTEALRAILADVQAMKPLSARALDVLPKGGPA